MACCKLGEEIFHSLIHLYERNTNEDKMKANLVEFFLLQVAIHNPKGVKREHPAAYAVSWESWKNCLCNIYDILTKEIDTSLELTIKNQSFFIVKNGVVKLFESFVCLFVEVCRQLFDDCVDVSPSGSLLEERPSKRQRFEFSTCNLIEKIKRTKSWTWLNLTYSLIESYPDMINSDDYLSLLKTLTSLQVECKEISLTYHINKALLIVQKLENTIDIASHKPQLDSLWKSVADSTLRLIGMNQNEEQVQNLLQQLLVKKYIDSHESLFQFYKPGSAMTPTEHNLETLDTAFKNLTYLQFDDGLKTETMRWILSNNSRSFCQSHVAEILVSLVLKQWPDSCTKVTAQSKKPFEDVEDVYFSISFEKLLVAFEDSDNVTVTNVFCPDRNLFGTLVELLTKLTKDIDVENSIGDLLNVTVLTFHVMSCMSKYDVIDVGAINNSRLYEFFQMCATNLFANLDLNVQRNDERKLEKTIEYLQTLNVLFSAKTSQFLAQQLRKLVPEGVIKAMFVGLTIEFEDRSHQEGQFVTFKNSLMQTLVSFSCLPDSGSLSVIQQRALEALVNTDYECNSESDYALVQTLLHSFKSCNPKSLSEDTLLYVFNLFQKVCEVRYHCYLSAVQILDLFCEIYPFVAVSDSDICKSQFVEILYPFYLKRKDYGPGVSISLLRCMSLLYELEPDCLHSKWVNEEIVLKIPEFLISDYQEVRFAAIRYLAKFFEISAKTRLLSQYHRQEIMFSKICEMSLQVFQVEGEVNEERMIDETVTRSSSILHTFASIMVASNLWVEEALFRLVKIVCDKSLDLRQVKLVIQMVSKVLNFTSGLKFLEKYLVGLVNRWKPYDIETFPFCMYNCNSKIQFYAKYWSVLAPLIIENDSSVLNQIALTSGKTINTIIEGTCPILLSYCIGQEVSDFASIPRNKIYILLCDVLGKSKPAEVFRNDIEEVILSLSHFICDENDFKSSFDENIIFPKTDELRLRVSDFYDCLQFIEGTIFQEKPIMSHLMQNNPEKVHFILLQLNLRISRSQALEEKLRYFHLYSIISQLAVDSVTSEPSLQPYLIRNLTHNLLHHIKNHKNQLALSQISCKFFKTILQKILPDLAPTVSQFFLIIVSRLKNIALENCPISDLCVDMLHFLIVDHKDYFRSEIEKLDSIPKTPKFETIFSVHYAIKYNNRKVTLEDEIRQFLDFGKNIESYDECEHSLTQLRTLLTTRKNEMKSLYSSLRDSRGFSEDCENSSLHKLICMLITLSCSSNKNVSSEAARCLGEIGPADLATLILQPEKPIPESMWSPWELVIGHAVSLLSKYVVDSDVEVIKVASLALFQVLMTKEGRKVAESETDFGFGAINCSYLAPFCAISPHKTTFRVAVNGDLFVQTMANDELWSPRDTCHQTWITKLVCTLLETFQETEFFASFIEVCKVKTEFCEQILPLVVYTVLYLNIVTLTKLISTQIANFFAKHWDITVNNRNCDSITTNKSSVQAMLNVVHFVRLQRSIRNKKISEMSLDYLKIAKAAHFCTAHFTALLYAELWCQEQIDLSPDDYALSTCSYTKLDVIYERVDEVTGNALQNILRQAYKAVGEVDALLGCGTSHLLNPTTRVEHYKEVGRWDQVMYRYEMEVSLGRKAALRPLEESLRNANLYQLSLFCSNALDEPNYESLWRLGQWDTKTSKSDLSHNTYDKCKFYAFKALHEGDEFSFRKSMDEGRACVVKDLMGANMESIKNFYLTLTRLQCLKEIEDFAQYFGDDKVSDLVIKWKAEDEIIINDYQYVEPVQTQRIVLLMEVLKKNARAQKDVLRDFILETIIDYAQYARNENNSHVAFRTLENLRLLTLSNDISAKVRFEEAQLCWSIQDVVTAKCILRQLCTNENVNPRLHAMALKMTGMWMVESSSENRQTIIENYFQKSLNLLEKNVRKTAEDEKSVLDTFDQLAKFADREYQEVMSHIKSDIFQKKKENVLKAQQAISGINLKRATKDLKKAVAIKQKQSCIDEIEINNIETEKNNLLDLALRYYLLNLIGSDEHNIAIFRLISLLLENRNNHIAKPVLEKDLLQIPTYKFINILPQIIPHISSASSDLFSQAVNKVIENCAKDHPYHTLPLILALALSNKDRDYAESKAVVNDARMQSAINLLKKLKSDRKMANLIDKMEFMSEAVIELAYFDNDGNDNASFKLPKHLRIVKIKNYDDVLLPTFTLPVNKSCEYNRIIGISYFSDKYHNVGGINAPKRIACRGTDGVTRTQLIKGQDDLRQDAVMQQVFTIMNSLLTVNKQTKNLIIRTYKIVPLSMRSGILEWVENTMPIGEYLSGGRGDGGAHAKYRPMDKVPAKCRAEFKNTANQSNEDRLRNFKKICMSIKPVFHKFFEEIFPQPTVWYERRRAYIHSVATSSMCGYILGIGDRHVNNILIDKSTAEVVHIDFGIAFEQGRVLPTPETVPFRLTRDIVDGMGVSGVEGVFRRSCEKTVDVLRLHYQTIITILEVLLYDPLYDWTVSTAEANKRQKDEQDVSQLQNATVCSPNDETAKDVNVTAERALLRLKAKLQGTESGKLTTVEHQVGTLIQQAVDPSNLSRLFYGWQPYL